jgi:hypothetical protein
LFRGFFCKDYEYQSRICFFNPPVEGTVKLESSVKLMPKNSISAGLVSKLHFKMTMMAVDESSDLMGEVAEVAYHLSLHNCRGVVTSLLHLGLSSLYVPERSFVYLTVSS